MDKQQAQQQLTPTNNENNNNNSNYDNRLDKLIASENHKKITVEPIHIETYLNENFYNESFLTNCEQLKQKLLNEKSILLSLLDKLNDKSSINQLLTDSKNNLDQLNNISKKRKELSNELEAQTNSTSIDNLSKYTNLINQLTRIKKYFQILLIIHMFYSKVKLCIDQSLLSLSLKPFCNLIELQNNLNSLKVPTGPTIIDHEERIDQIFPHLTKVVDHVVTDTSLLLENKMKLALTQSLKDINWINISNTASGTGNFDDDDDHNSKKNTSNKPIKTTPTTSASTTTSTSSSTSPNTPQTEKERQQEEIKNKLKIRSTFINNFTNLILLQLSIQKYSNNTSGTVHVGGGGDGGGTTPTKLWSINLILLPLIKGFKYHFQSERVTNFIEKPEWAIHYVKKLIREYSRYLCMLQDSLEDNHVYYIDVHQWFIAGLVEAVKNKFRGEINLFLERPEHYKRYFFHTMEEIVEFQRFLSQEYSYPNPIEYGNVMGGIEMGLINDVGIIPVPFSIFQEKSIFDRWLQLEIENCDQQFVQLYDKNEDRFNLHFDRDDAFPDLDQLRPTNSSYELISMLSSLTDRYSLLTDKNCQFQFFIQIQINLLLRYKNELKGIISILLSDSNSGSSNLLDLSHIFNSLNYIIKVLKEWDDQLIFIEIYDYMNSNKSTTNTTNSSTYNRGDEDYSAFSIMISDFKQLLKQLKKKLVKSLFLNFTQKTNNYLKRGTFSNQMINNPSSSSSSITSSIGNIIGSSSSLIGTSKNLFSFSNLKNKFDHHGTPSSSNVTTPTPTVPVTTVQPQDIEQQQATGTMDEDQESMYSQFDVSNEISNGLSILRYQLGIIYKSITPVKLSSIWKKLLIKIDQYLFGCLLNYQPKFTENDGKQLSKDVKTCLLIFNTFSNTPENYMKKLLESTIILRMGNLEFTNFKLEFNNKLKVNLVDELLQKYQIFNLSNDQIIKIINLRIVN